MTHDFRIFKQQFALVITVLAAAAFLNLQSLCAQTILSSGWFLHFDGVDDRVDMGSFDVSGSAITIEAWFRADNLANCGSSDCRIISKAIGTAEAEHYWMLSTIRSGSATRLRFRLKTNGSTQTLIASAGDLSDGVWTHAAAVYDGSQMRLYKDGVLVGSAPKTGGIDTNNSALVWIGDNPPLAGSRPFAGSIDEVRIWNKALSKQEIRDNKDRELTGNEGGLIGYWKFNEGSGQTAFDSTGKAGNGMLGSTTGTDASDPIWVLAAPPPIAITSPLGGATVSGVTTVCAAASDALSGVQFKLDGENLGTARTTSPYCIAWDSATTSNCDHSLHAVAIDPFGNTLVSSGVPVTVSNVDSPSMIHYVRAGASGNNTGSDWNNAFTELPARLLRGHTYLVAAGGYRSYTFAEPGCDTSVITVKKATAAAHGTNIGWNDMYGAGVATWGNITVRQSYFIFDGAVGTATSGHGFEIFPPAAAGALFALQDSPTNVTVTHVNMHFATRDLAVQADGIFGATGASDIRISDCYIHEIPRAPLLMRGWTNMIFERNWVARNKSTPEVHSEGVSNVGGSNHTYKDNVWEDIEGTGVIVNLDGPSSNWEIYGNIFFDTATGGGIAHGIVADNFGKSTIVNLRYYNNTAVNIKGINSGLRFFASAASSITAYNNLWFRCESVGMVNVTHGYNYYSDSTFTFEYNDNPGLNDQRTTGDPFVDSANRDFHLIVPTEPGLPLPSPYEKDLDGKARGADGVWDRGAYEFVSNRSPTARCRDVTVLAGSTCAASASIENGSSDPDGDPITLSQFPAGPYALGNTLVTLTVRDNKGGSSSCTATVTVVDRTPPVILAPPAVSVGTGPGAKLCGKVIADADLGAATASDNCSGAPFTRSGVPAGNLFPVGTSTITYVAADASGNTATATQTVTVVDSTPPAITCPSPISVEFTSAAGAGVAFLPIVIDNCPAPITTISIPSSGSTFSIGITTVNCSATDAAGNTAACAFPVTVLGPLFVKRDVLDDLSTLRAIVTNKEDGEKLDDAIKHLRKSLDTIFWIDQTHLAWKEGAEAFQEEKDTVSKLRELLKEKKSSIADTMLQGLIDRIVRSDRLLALVAINDAIRLNGDAKGIAKAKDELALGDGDVESGQLESGIEHYRNAWDHASQAVSKNRKVVGDSSLLWHFSLPVSRITA